MTEQRESKRVSCQKVVEFGLIRFGPPPDPPRYKGYVVDLSDGGLFIKTDRVFKAGIRLSLEIKDGGKSYSMQGTVSNSKKVPPAMEDTVKSGMGIMISNLDPELLRMYRDKVDS